MLKDLVKRHGLEYIGCEPVELNRSSKGSRQYSREYSKLIKQLEKDLLNKKSLLLRQHNRAYYQKKCQDLIDKSDVDQHSRAAANLMLNSECEHLEEMRKKYQGKLGPQDLRISSDQMIDLDDQKVQDIIDSIKSKTVAQSAEKSAG